ncbi:hypothetical protein BJY04DRAFT_229600 [Aspergillus karnatakaensis]|uniref:SNG1 family protein n=1 Tax=Aspergillus karnatakaensis TaxID=1810916 RepID=UPI003CCCFB14
MHLPKPFIGAVAGAFVTLQLLFLVNMTYLYGSAFQSSSRYHSLDILYVDYDHDVIGQSVMAGYQFVQSPGFVSLHEKPADEYPSPSDIRQAVCRGDYWGAIYTNSDASKRLSNALTDPQLAASYDSSQALTYVVNTAKYASTAEIISGNLQGVVSAARSAYTAINGTAVMATVNTTNPAIANTLFNPISASTIDIKPSTQGTRFFYNTVGMVMPILQQFFFVMALNGISAQFGLFRSNSLTQNIALRVLISFAYTLVAALLNTGYIWYFRESWLTTSSQFGLTWMAFWLAMHVNFLIIDTATAFIPMQFMSFFVLTWVIINVTSTIFPFEISPGFYRVGYALPAHELYETLVDIWTEGCNPILYRSLPILFSWWIVGWVAFGAGMWKRVSGARAEVKDMPRGDSRGEEVELVKASA